MLPIREELKNRFWPKLFSQPKCTTQIFPKPSLSRYDLITKLSGLSSLRQFPQSSNQNLVQGPQKKIQSPSPFIHHSRGPSLERASLNPVHETDFRAEEVEMSEEEVSQTDEGVSDQILKDVERVLENN